MAVTQHQADAECRASAETPEDYRYLASFAELVTTLTSRLVNPVSGLIDREIDEALRRIGDFAAVDRSYVFQFSIDGARVSNTHEWCAEGVTAMMDQIQDAPVEQFGWAIDRFKRGDVLYVEDVERLPPDSLAVKQELQRQGVQSILNVPLISSGRVLGFVGFDAVKQKKTWQDRHIELLKVVGEIIAGAIERCRAHDTLNRQVVMETLVAQASSRFINVATSSINTEIDRAIAAIGEFTGVDRSYVFLLSQDGATMSNTHEWCAKGVTPQSGRLQNLPVAHFEYSTSMMRAGEVFYVEDTSQLPMEALAGRLEFEKEGITTLINVPIIVRGSMMGFLGFDAVRERKVWSQADVRLLRLVSEIFANALDRKMTDERLQSSLHEKELLLKEIHHRVKNNLQIVDSLLYLQACTLKEEADETSLEAFRQSQGRIRAMAAIHEHLYRAPDLAAVDLHEYLGTLVPDLVASYSVGERIQVRIRGSSIRLGIDRAIPCALIINELLTNCLKHAFSGGRHGRIEVSIERSADGVNSVSVSDDGAGFSQGVHWRKYKTLGLRLVGDLIAQLDGELHVTVDKGTQVFLTFPGDSDPICPVP